MSNADVLPAPVDPELGKPEPEAGADATRVDAPDPCWQCEAPLERGAAACARCSVVQPPMPLDPFARLGLAPEARLTTADVASRRTELLLKFHPDRFAAHSPRAGEYALALTTAINDAARALRTPTDRLVEILRLRDIDPTPLTPGPEFFTLLQEFEAALQELAGIDAHAERAAVGRALAHRHQATWDTLATELAQDAPAPQLRRRFGEIRALHDLIDRLEALDTTPDRLGRRRR